MAKRLLLKEKGSALPMVLVALAVFSILGVTLARYVSAETKSAKETQYFLEARYLAEAGVEKALFQIKKSLQNNGTGYGSYFYSNNFPGGNYINPGYNIDTANGITVPLIPLAPTSADTVTFAGSNGITFTGELNWVYDTDPDSNNIHWRYNSTENTFAAQTPGSYPDTIFFYRTIIGTGRILRSDGTVIATRQIKVRANISYVPVLTPDAPVSVTVLQWQDI